MLALLYRVIVRFSDDDGEDGGSGGGGGGGDVMITATVQ